MRYQANAHAVPVTEPQRRLIFANCIQAQNRKWLGSQHDTLNITRTAENLQKLSPNGAPAGLTEVKQAMALLY